MPDLTSEKLKEFAGTVGVDVLGLHPTVRFDGAPEAHRQRIGQGRKEDGSVARRF